MRALDDVAAWLGYRGNSDYNEACKKQPASVRKRIKEAK